MADGVAAVRAVEIEPTFAAWRAAARRLLAEQVPPVAIDWQSRGGAFQQAALPLGMAPAPESRPSESSVAGAVLRESGAPSASAVGGEVGGDTPGAGTGDAAETGITTDGPRVPKAFLKQARGVLCHRSPERWGLAYRLLWRLTHGEPRLLEIEVDPDVVRFRTLAKEVRRDCHKMKAFVRFRRVERRGESGDPETWYVAWHRPDHPIVERVAPFFVERFNDQRWSILTPETSAHWDLERLEIGPGVPRSEAPDGDQLEDLWRTYYAHIFNPARLKVRAMKAELPVRHWATLPEADLIPGLIRDARSRTADMLEEGRPPATAWIAPEADLADLTEAVQDCRACELCTMGRAVFGEGPADARVVLVGEQPGDQEEQLGRPFVGPAGEVLDRALNRAGLDRSAIYLTNAVKHFKHEMVEASPAPGGPARATDPKARRGKRRLHRTPGMTEVTSCRPWLEAELARIRPEIVVCLGATAGRSLLGGEIRLKHDRGKPRPSRHAPWTLLTYHPAALLRIPDEAALRAAEKAFTADLARAEERLQLARTC